MKAKLNSVYLAVKNMKRAVAFYEKILGRKVKFYDFQMSIFELSNISFLLFDPKYGSEKISFGNNAIVNFEVKNIKEAQKFIKHQKCKIVMALAKVNQYYIFQVKDPEGNIIEFYQVIK